MGKAGTFLMHKSQGRVILVGAGPGDPELITVRGLRAIRSADTIVYDRLVDYRLLEEASPAAEKIFVGKRGGHYSFPQDEINRILVEHARKGCVVTRLKGGDPFLFGRGGEEQDFLRRQDIDFEIVPGVTSATAVPAVFGIPLTHRGIASSVAIVSGHQIKGAQNQVDWKKLALGAETLVVLMPLRNLELIVSELLAAGLSRNTPVALIQSGTYSDQQCLISSLAQISVQARTAGITSPALLVVGSVVSLADLASTLADHRNPAWRSQPAAPLIRLVQ